MPTWTLTMNFQTHRLNELVGCHWGTAARRKRLDRESVALAFRASGIPRATTRRRVSLLVTLGPRQRGPDKDAFQKSLWDALVSCGALVDDSPRWCELGTVSYARGPRRGMTVTLDDMDDD